MIDPHSQALLQDVLRRESRSVLMYVDEAYPWTTVAEEKSLTDLRQIISAEREALTALGRFLLRQHIPLPYLPTFPSSFTTINFLALDYVLPRLIDYERRAIAELERDLPALKDSAAHAEVEKLLALKRRHLPQLEALVPARTPASVS